MVSTDTDEVIEQAIEYIVAEREIPEELRNKLVELELWEVFNEGT